MRAGRRVPRRAWPLLYLAPALLIYGVFVLWPLVRLAWLGLFDWNGYGPLTFIGLDNYASLWQDPVFRTSLWDSVRWELAAVLVTPVLGLLLALVLRRARGRSLILSALFFPALLPATVVAAIWTLVYSPLTGLLNRTLRGLGLGGLASDWLGDPHLALGALFVAWLWSAVGLAALMFWAALTTISREYLELALAEGAGVLWRFRHVELPAVRRTGLAVALISAALAAQVFDLVFVTTGGGPGYATMILPVDMYGRAFGGHTGQGAADATVQVALGLLFTALALSFLGRSGDSLDTGERELEQRPSKPATAGAAACALVVLLPLGWLLVAALEPNRDFALGVNGLGPNPLGWNWASFASVWSAGMGSSQVLGLGLAASAVVGSLLLAVPAAFALSSTVRRSRWRLAAAGVLLLGLLQPTQALIIPLFYLLRDLRLLNTVWGILLPEVGRTLPLAVLLLWLAMSQLPREVIEAARIDGASPWRTMLGVTLPLVRPALAAVAIWSFVTSWNEYLLPTLVSQGGSLQTVPTLLAGFTGKYDTEFGPLAAGALLALAPSLLIFLSLRSAAGSALRRADRSTT